MNQSRTLRNESDRAAAVRWIQSINLKDPLRLTLIEYKPNRSAAQNRLFWMWAKSLGDHLGYTKDEMVDQFRHDQLLPLMLEHADRYPEAERVVELIEAFPDRALLICRILSTTSLTVAHFAQLLTDIDRFAASMGYALPHPEDLYYEAIGRRAA